MSASNLNIRFVEEQDFAAASVLAAKMVRFHHELDPVRFPIFYEPLEPGYEAFLRDRAAEKESVVMVAVLDGTVVGYLFGRVEPRNWNDLMESSGIIHDLFVDEAARGHGAGKKLMLAAIAELKKRGAPQIILKAAPMNENAIGLFKSLGFRLSFIEMLLEN